MTLSRAYKLLRSLSVSKYVYVVTQQPYTEDVAERP